MTGVLADRLSLSMYLWSRGSDGGDFHLAARILAGAIGDDGSFGCMCRGGSRCHPVVGWRSREPVAAFACASENV